MWERCLSSYIFSIADGMVAMHPMPKTVSVGKIRILPDLRMFIAVFMFSFVAGKIIVAFFLLFLD